MIGFRQRGRMAESQIEARALALAEIRRIVGERGWIDDPEEMRPHLVEWRGLWNGAACAVVRPGSTEEVSEVVRRCAAARIAIVPQAGNTSLCGGSVPDESGSAIVLSVARLNRIREFDPIGDTMTAEAGCILADVQRAADAAGRLFPLSLAAGGAARSAETSRRTPAASTSSATATRASSSSASRSSCRTAGSGTASAT